MFSLTFSRLSEGDCSNVLDAARFSLLAYADKSEVDNLAENRPTEWTTALGHTLPTEMIWPCFECYKKDYKVFHNAETDADVLVAANTDQATI